MYANHLCNGLLTIPQSSAGADRSDLKDTGELYGVSHTVNQLSTCGLRREPCLHPSGRSVTAELAACIKITYDDNRAAVYAQLLADSLFSGRNGARYLPVLLHVVSVQSVSKRLLTIPKLWANGNHKSATC